MPSGRLQEDSLLVHGQCIQPGSWSNLSNFILKGLN
jgi:hypothetical protein